MTKKSLTLTKKKKRIKIKSINDFKNALKQEKYNINDFGEEKLKEEIINIFKIEKNIADKLYACINDAEIIYKVNDTKDFIDYIQKIEIFETKYNKLCEKIEAINNLDISRVEYDRIMTTQDNVDDILKEIQEIKEQISQSITEKEKYKLKMFEQEIDKSYLYAKDIELLKKMIIANKKNIKEQYNEETKVKTISIKIPNKINYDYIKHEKGSVEYHQYLTANIPRLIRLINNIDKYIKSDKYDKSSFKINQSSAIQDSVNIAMVTYNDKEFRAISGSNDVKNCCKVISKKDSYFKSSKVNKQGKLGIGYNRFNDSEKKILEEIHKQIQRKELKDYGNLILYSKWEPCPSCYYVISQFCKKYPNINVEVKYSDKYGI